MVVGAAREVSPSSDRTWYDHLLTCGQAARLVRGNAAKLLKLRGCKILGRDSKLLLNVSGAKQKSKAPKRISLLYLSGEVIAMEGIRPPNRNRFPLEVGFQPLDIHRQLSADLSTAHAIKALYVPDSQDSCYRSQAHAPLLLVADCFRLEKHLRLPRFPHSTDLAVVISCAPKQSLKKLKEALNPRPEQKLRYARSANRAARLRKMVCKLHEENSLVIRQAQQLEVPLLKVGLPCEVRSG